jgi:hypothetical protein
MPTVIRMVAPAAGFSELLSEQGRAVLPFIAIGLALLAIAAMTGVQGVWL